MKFFFLFLIFLVLIFSSCVALPNDVGEQECNTDDDCSDYTNKHICNANGDCEECPVFKCTAPPNGCQYVPNPAARCQTCGLLKCNPTEPVPTCYDNKKNGQETGVDCGGPSCPACNDQGSSYEDLYGSRTKYSCDYYASPEGEGDGLSESNSFLISDFWNVNNIQGKTLCLVDGVYKGIDSMIQPPEYLSGEQGKPIRVVALQDGKVLIDGEKLREPLYLKNNDWYIFEGFNLRNAAIQSSKSHGISVLFESNNIIYRRIIGWENGNPDVNAHIFFTPYSKNVLYEDVAGFGTARKIFEIAHKGDSNSDTDQGKETNNVARRIWGRLEKNYWGGVGAMSVSYNTNGNIIENGIATIDGEFRNDAKKGSSNVFGYFNDRTKDKNNQILGSIFYSTKEQKVLELETNSFLFVYGDNSKVENFLSFVEGKESDYGKNLRATAQLNPKNYKNFEAKYLTFIGGPGVGISSPSGSIISNIIALDMTWNEEVDIPGGHDAPATALWVKHPDFDPVTYAILFNNKNHWSLNNNRIYEPEHYSIENPKLIERFGNLLQYGTGERPKVDGQAVGAQIACRYEDGVLTSKPLWPWPMEERIRVATCMYDEGKSMEFCEQNKQYGVQVTKTVFELGGGSVPNFEELNPIVCPGN